MGNQGSSGCGSYGKEHLDELKRNLVKNGELWEKTGDEAYENRMVSCKNLIDMIEGKSSEEEKNPGII